VTFFNNSAVVFNTGTTGATTATPAPGAVAVAVAAVAGDIMTLLPPFNSTAELCC